jgi:hypothetical protein
MFASCRLDDGGLKAFVEAAPIRLEMLQSCVVGQWLNCRRQCLQQAGNEAVLCEVESK